MLDFLKYGKVYADEDGLVIRFHVKPRTWGWLCINAKVWNALFFKYWWHPGFWFMATPYIWLRWLLTVLINTGDKDDINSGVDP